MILHIPHASTNTLNYEIKNKERELLRMTDHFTDDLYKHDEATRIVFGVSRLVCDVERFSNDAEEKMSRFGMGVCYTRDTEGEELKVVNDEDREYILNQYYHVHHKKLTDAVDKELDDYGTALIVDCHSFPQEAYYFNSDFNEQRPDICIGTDYFHTPKELVEKVKSFFLSKGYHVSVDKPYSGTMVPLKHYHKDKNVHSLMIEVNRKLYISEDGSRNEHYITLQNELTQLFDTL